MKKINLKKYDWFNSKGELVIKDGKALKDIDKNEILYSYGGVKCT